MIRGLLGSGGHEQRSFCRHDLDKVGVKFPMRNTFEFCKTLLRYSDCLAGIFAVTDLDDPLDDLERMPIGAKQILDEAHHVAGHGHRIPQKYDFLHRRDRADLD